MTTAVLKHAERTKSFILRTDASNYALSAVLLWSSDKAFEHPIEYDRCLLISAETNYSTAECEALAVVWAKKNFLAM